MKKILCCLLAMVFLLVFPGPVSAVDSAEIPLPPPEIEEIIEEYQMIYRLTVHYIYLDGTPAAPTYVEQLLAGSPYGVESPEIEGYTPSTYLVSGVMPSRDMEYTVIYIPIPKDPGGPSYLTIEDFETPLGLGVIYMHIGICIE